MSEASRGEDRLLLTGFRWVGPEAGRAARQLAICGEVVDGRPSAVRPSAGRVVDLEGSYLCPGLVDLHVHLTRGEPRDFSGSRPDQDSGPARAGGAAAPQANLAGHLRAGVTALRTLGDREEDLGALPASVAGTPLPRVVSAARALTARGGYGGFLGREVGPQENPVELVSEEVARGARVLKVIVSGPVDFETMTAAPPHFSPAFLRDLVRAGRAAGLPVSAHANGPDAVRLAVEAGVDTVEHGILAGRAEIEFMAQRGVAWVPTISPLVALAESGRYPRLSGLIESYLQSIAYGRECGVSVAPGTDGGCPGVPHGSLFVELSLLALAGFSPTELLEAATRKAGILARLPDGYGTLAPGTPADAVWFSHDPFAGFPDRGRFSAIYRSPVPRARGAVVRGRLVWWSDH